MKTGSMSAWGYGFIAAIVLTAITVGAAEMPDQVRDMLEKSLAAYRGLESYQDKQTTLFEARMIDAEGELDEQTHNTESSFTFKAPNRFRGQAEGVMVLCNGETVWVVNEELEQYVEASRSDINDFNEFFSDIGLHNLEIELLDKILLMRELSLDDLLDSVSSWAEIQEEKLGDVDCYVINGTFEPAAAFPTEEALPFKAYLAKDDLLLREICIDATKPYQALMASMREGMDEEDMEDMPSKIERMTWRITYNDIQTNQRIADADFSFQPAADMKKVDEFESPAGRGGAYLELIGKPAPVFSGTDIDGQAIALGDFRGRVVLLDFWATWCGPCMLAIPEIQKVAMHFTNQPVTVIGLNRDPEGREENVKKVLEKKNITFRQLADADGGISEEYKVHGIPHTVLIDTNGIIQWVHVGASGDESEILIENIERLLKGEQLYDPDEIREKMEELDEDDMDDGVDEDIEQSDEAGTNDVLQAVNADSIIIDSQKRGQFMGWRVKEFDLDGDGHNELLLPNWKGVLTIMDATGEEVNTIRFQGLSQHTSIHDYVPVKTGDGAWSWLISQKRHRQNMNDKSLVALYSNEGKKQWQYTPTLNTAGNREMEILLAHGDVTGDGQPECVLGIESYKRVRLSENSWRHESHRGYLVVLDINGQVLAIRPIGKDLDWLRVMPANQPGAPAVILISGSGKIWRCHVGAVTDSADHPPAQP
ncbi:MAG: redoxin domain-containing protein [Spartobacteria bacterium]|nr:redoxin domain-containing protein [Spartobacteria bacterium]